MRKSRYLIFVTRDDSGRLRKIPIPLRYAYIFVAAALVGLFTITGLAGSYSRMLLKTARFDQVRTERESLRQDYLQMERVAHEKDVQAASLSSLAGEVSALYGLRQSRLAKTSAARQAVGVDASSDGLTDGLSDQQYSQSLRQFVALRSSAMSGAMSGEIARRFDFGIRFPLHSAIPIEMADAPSIWPVQGTVSSSFGERQDPFLGEGAFHSGIDIATELGDPVHASADGTVLKAGTGEGYGREIILDNGQNIETLYAHLSGFAVTAGQDVRRGDIIGYVGSSGRSTGPHLHYEVRIRNTPVNPRKYLPGAALQFARTGSHAESSGAAF